MVNFNSVTIREFLTHYWQKKPLLFRDAIPEFHHFLTADDLAGLAMEEEVESRLVFETPKEAPYWSLKRGPFEETIFANLPQTHWTLLVQGVDRYVPEVAGLLDHFNFLPQWRVDDVMISYAVKEGSVGPHYDNYDVFLYQAKGRRKWLLTTKDCVESNYCNNVPLKIMKIFQTENEFILEEGDMLYLPPHVAHHGISLDDDCMTYSFGYRSYQALELWDSLGEYLADTSHLSVPYQDPSWLSVSDTAQLPQEAWLRAKDCMQAILDDENLLKKWFASYVTTLDQHAESMLPFEEEQRSFEQFKATINRSRGLIRNTVCRFAYQLNDQSPYLTLYVNGCEWAIEGVDTELVKLVANNRTLLFSQLLPYLEKEVNHAFLYALWQQKYLDLVDSQ